jgi:hypothetical protein
MVELDQLHRVSFDRLLLENKAGNSNGAGATAPVRRPAKAPARRRKRHG